MADLVFKPNEKQKLFLAADTTYVGFGGSRGGGKSWSVQAKAIISALAYKGIRCLIIRRTLDELKENHITPMRLMLKDTAEWRDKDKEFIFPNGSVIKFGYCDSERDTMRYQGQQYDLVFLDEGTQLTEYQWDIFKGCCRGVNDFPKRIYVTCNPGGPGHAWVKRLFIDRDYRSGERAEDYTFIQSGVYDNKVLLEKDPKYVRRLESLPYELRQAWLFGNWDVMAGQYFSEWNREIHVCAPFPVPEHWRWYVTMDYGMDMLAAYLICVDERGNAWVTDEIYEGRDLGETDDGKVHNGLIVSEAAKEIKAMAGERDIYAYLAPPDLFNRRQETGRSVADIFAENGIYLTKTSNDRVDGWMAMHEMLKVRPDETGEPTALLRIWPKCVNLIRCLPLLQYDSRRVNDVANEPHEITHAPDALRGFCVQWVSAAQAMKEKPPEKLIKKLQKQKAKRII